MSEKERVLVVDDSPQNCVVATGHLQASGYEVVAVTSGEEALEVLESGQRIDLVVLDVLMPGIGGFETCRRIRTTPAFADVPVLFLTALDDRETTTPALEAGGDDLLTKPFNRAELMLRARALIRQRKTTAQLEEAMRALAKQNAALRQLELDKRRMSQLVVHDLRGPIGAVMANSELLKRTVDGEAAEMCDDILIAAQQLERTARDLLDLSRAEDGELVPRVESFSLGALATEVASSLRGVARWSSVAIALDIGTDRVVADRELTRRLLQNLVHNALKHAPPKTVVSIHARIDGDGLVLRVADEGPGVPAHEVDRIFDPFVTLDRTSSRTTGHGLGLAFCRMAAEAHGGRVWVEPRAAGQAGASFCVRIPQPVPSTQ